MLTLILLSVSTNFIPLPFKVPIFHDATLILRSWTSFFTRARPDQRENPCPLFIATGRCCNASLPGNALANPCLLIIAPGFWHNASLPRNALALARMCGVRSIEIDGVFTAGCQPDAKLLGIPLM